MRKPTVLLGPLAALALILCLAPQSLAGSAAVGGPVYQGTEVQCDLPVELHLKNIPAPRDRLGCCVFASLSHSARWHNRAKLMDVMFKIQYGGGWPQKVDQVIRQYDPDLKYVQYEGTDPTVLDKALVRRHLVCVTYGYGERYGMKTIAHMVNLVYLDQKVACVLDNNFPGSYEWMSREEFLKRWKWPNGTGWAIVLLEPTPPPIPSN